jgi:pimeloyl-ACP methyl ester carboxylesterase
MFELAEELSSNCRCVIFDRFGYGFSDVSDNSRTFSQITKETKLLFEALNVTNNIVFIGHSIATFHALDFANSYPQLIKGVVLIDSYPFNSSGGRFLFNINWVIAYCLLLFRKLGVLNKISDKNLTKLLFGKRNMPESIVTNSLIALRKGLYNKTVRNELKCAISDLKYLYANTKNLSNIPVVSICRGITYKFNKKYRDYITNYSLVNVGKSTHYIQHVHMKQVASEILKLCM